jgi:hypothetical protein
VEAAYSAAVVDAIDYNQEIKLGRVRERKDEELWEMRSSSGFVLMQSISAVVRNRDNVEKHES